MTGALQTGLWSCTPDQYATSGAVEGTLCVFTQTAGGAIFVLFFGVLTFAMLAAYSRTVGLPAVVSVLVMGAMGQFLPSLGIRINLLVLIAVATAMLYLAYRAID